MLRLIEQAAVNLRRNKLIQRLYGRLQYQRYLSRAARWEDKRHQGQLMITSLAPGLKMQLHRDSMLGREIYLHDFEHRERHFVQSFLNTGDVFVDVGANIGLFTLIAAQVVGPTGHVYAFEPGSVAFAQLRANVALNTLKQVVCLPYALSDRPEQLPLMVATDGWEAYSSFAQPISGDQIVAESVVCMTWDDFVAGLPKSPQPVLMKIDVEGWEQHVLAGAAVSLRKPDAPALLVEFTDAAAQAAGSSCAQLYRAIEQLSYTLYQYDHASRSLVPEPLRASYPYSNLVAVKDLAAALDRLRQ